MTVVGVFRRGGLPFVVADTILSVPLAEGVYPPVAYVPFLGEPYQQRLGLPYSIKGSCSKLVQINDHILFCWAGSMIEASGIERSLRDADQIGNLNTPEELKSLLDTVPGNECGNLHFIVIMAKSGRFHRYCRNAHPFNMDQPGVSALFSEEDFELNPDSQVHVFGTGTAQFLRTIASTPHINLGPGRGHEDGFFTALSVAGIWNFTQAGLENFWGGATEIGYIRDGGIRKMDKIMFQYFEYDVDKDGVATVDAMGPLYFQCYIDGVLCLAMFDRLGRDDQRAEVNFIGSPARPNPDSRSFRMKPDVWVGVLRPKHRPEEYACAVSTDYREFAEIVVDATRQSIELSWNPLQAYRILEQHPLR